MATQPSPLPAGSYLASAALEPTEVVELGVTATVPLLSVVIPNYNHHRYLLELLPALAEQQAGKFEVVVVDDGSTEGSFGALVERFRACGLAGRLIRLPRNRAQAVARNVGILHARAPVIAFIDSDCLPAAGWLAAGERMLATSPKVGMVQGITRPHPGQPQPLFNHFIAKERLDGSFATCNIFYRKDAIQAAGGFDPSAIGEDDAWEDTDLGWRVHRLGWQTRLAPAALVYHHVLVLSPMQWLRWPRHFVSMPAKASRYPEIRRHLFLGVWVEWDHALFDIAAVAVILSLLVHPAFTLLMVPYLVALPLRHGLKGRWPPLKAAAYVAWDAHALVVLLKSSLQHRSLVL
jgi:GT2 family glycosyltransferase